MGLMRRDVLIGAGGVVTTGSLFSKLGKTARAQVTSRIDGIGVTIGFDGQTITGLSDTVTIETLEDPFQPDQPGKSPAEASNNSESSPANDSGRGNSSQSEGNNRGDVLHVTSVADDSSAESGVTFDIAMSIINVSKRELTVSDIADYDGDRPGLAYDWAATETDVMGVDTNHEGVGSPDDVWFFLDETAEDDATRTDQSGPFFTDSTPVFRTMYADQTGESDDTATAGWEYNQWNTRTVTDEFEADGWKELSLEQQSFAHLDDNLLETYGDASVVGVGISRGDPYYGPSVLDSYYRNLHLNGEQYSFPASLELGASRPR